MVGQHVERTAAYLVGRCNLGTEVGRSGSWRSSLGSLAGPSQGQWSAHAEASERNSLVPPLCEMGLGERMKMRCCRGIWCGVVTREWGSGGSTACAKAGKNTRSSISPRLFIVRHKH